MILEVWGLPPPQELKSKPFEIQFESDYILQHNTCKIYSHTSL